MKKTDIMKLWLSLKNVLNIFNIRDLSEEYRRYVTMLEILAVPRSQNSTVCVKEFKIHGLSFLCWALGNLIKCFWAMRRPLHSHMVKVCSILNTLNWKETRVKPLLLYSKFLNVSEYRTSLIWIPTCLQKWQSEY